LTTWQCPEHKQISRPGESEGDFRVRLSQVGRERRDLEIERLRARYAPRLEALAEQKRRAAERVERERSEFQQQSMQTAISLGATVIGALFGRKTMSMGTIGRATTAMRGAGRAARERGDIGRAEENIAAVDQKIANLQAEFEAESASHGASVNPADLALEEIAVRPRKADITVSRLALVWTRQP
ncbi:MAG: ATP-binding protein, partial [Vicinamibacteria bacterium]